MQHLDEGTIHAWLDGALDAEEAARVEQHAASCASCAAMVAEARGLIAGSSRILASLDNVPGGVIPKSGAVPARPRPRALWNVLHLTPARAAAAAVVFVAAGTALVLRYAPNERMEPKQTFQLVSHDTVMSRPVVVTAPVAANNAPTRPQPAIPAAAPVPVPAPQERASKKALARESSLMDVAVTSSPRVSDSLTAQSEKRAAQVAAPSAATADAAKSAAPPAVAGVVNAAPRPAPMALRAERAAGVAGGVAFGSASICYSIEGDSIPSLPRRVLLQSPSSVLGGATSPLPTWHWSKRPSGIRLWTESPTAAEVQLDSTAAPGELRGTATVGGRQLAVHFRRC